MMRTARFAEAPHDPVSVEDFWDRPGIRALNFMCSRCDVSVRPVAVPTDGQKFYLVKAHFRLAQGFGHASDCGQEDQAAIRARAQAESVLGGANPSVLVVSRLELRADVKTVSAAMPRSAQVAGALEPDLRAPLADVLTASRIRNGKASRINPIVDQYLNFPHDRSLPLEVPGKSGTYETVFSKLQSVWNGDRAPSGILFAKIGLKPISRTWNSLAVPLCAGQANESGTGPFWKRQVHLRINTEGWKEPSRDTLWTEIEQAQKAERERAPDRSGMLFFIGERDSHKRELFHADDRRLICAMVGAYPSATQSLRR